MTLRRCLGCTTRYAVGLMACPHCSSTDSVEAGAQTVWRCQTDDCTGLYQIRLQKCPRCHGTAMREEEYMPKITLHGGPSDVTLPEPLEDVPEAQGGDGESGGQESPSPAAASSAQINVGDGWTDVTPYIKTEGDDIGVGVGSGEAEPPAEPAKDLGEMSLVELRAKAKELGLAASGTKQDLVERIESAYEEDAE